MLSLLDERLIEVSSPLFPEGAATLPELLAALSRGEDVWPGRVAPHQCTMVLRFLCQIGAACVRADGILPTDAAGWRAKLVELTRGEDAWHLVSPDHALPAFLQPPLAGNANMKTVEQADDLTIRVLSKNHAVKQSRIADGTPWQWALALIELQTMSGYAGAGNCGISRMNGGYGSRPCVSIYPSLSWADRWRRDVRAILGNFEEIRKLCPWARESGGLVAVWTVPWDGASQIALGELDPLYVDVCRLVRLTLDGGRLSAVRTTTSVARIAAKDLKGVTGDPWAPVNAASGGSVLTLSENGWTRDCITRLVLGDLAGDLRPSPLMRRLPDETGDLFLDAEVLAGGQGKTGGWHRRTVRVPGPVAFDLFSDDGAATRATLAELSAEMSADAAKIRNALYWGVKVLVCGGDGAEGDVGPEKTGRTSALSAPFDPRVDADFFPWLWRRNAGSATRRDWVRHLLGMAEEVLGDAVRSHSDRGAFAVKAAVKAEGAMKGAFWKHFGEVMHDDAN